MLLKNSLISTTTGLLFTDQGDNLIAVNPLLGALANNGLAIGTIPSSGAFIQTSIANQVNLVNTQGLELSYWDGPTLPRNNGVINGGTGVWQSSAGNDNWTDSTGAINAPYQDATFAIFAGTPRPRATVSAMRRIGTPSSSTALYRAPACPCSKTKR